MANVKSAIRQIRKDERKRVQNQAVLSELKTLERKLTALTPKDRTEAESLVRTLASHWDRAVSAKIVPKRRADRKKSRTALFLSKLSSSH